MKDIFKATKGNLEILRIEPPKEKITTKEFFSRWGQGIREITPAQMNWINIQGNVMVLVGILIGLYATFNKTWWLFIILLGSLFITSMGLVGSVQKQMIINEFNKVIKEGSR